MKVLTSFWFISLFSFVFCDNNAMLRCGSPTCNAIISEARAHVQYHGNGIHVKRGDAVKIYGKSDNSYLIQHGDLVGFIPKTFLRENSLKIGNDNLVNVSQEAASNFWGLPLTPSSATPPLENASVSENGPENIVTEKSIEISSSKTFEVVDGTTLYDSDNNFAGETTSPSLEEFNPTTESNSDSLLDSPHFEKDNLELSQKAEPTEKEKQPESENEANVTAEEDEVESEEDNEENEIEDEGESIENEVEDVEKKTEEIDKGLGSKILTKAFDAFFGESTDSSEKLSDPQNVSVEKQSLETEAKDTVDNVQIPSTADLVSGATESVFYEATQSIFPTKTAVPVEATKQPALSQNADASKLVESITTSAEGEDTADLTEEETGGSSFAVEDNQEANETTDLNTPAATSFQAGIESREASVLQTEQNISTENSVQVDSGFLPTLSPLEQVTEVVVTEKPTVEVTGEDASLNEISKSEKPIVLSDTARQLSVEEDEIKTSVFSDSEKPVPEIEKNLTEASKNETFENEAQMAEIGDVSFETSEESTVAEARNDTTGSQETELVSGDQLREAEVASSFGESKSEILGTSESEKPLSDYGQQIEPEIAEQTRVEENYNKMESLGRSAESAEAPAPVTTLDPEVLATTETTVSYTEESSSLSETALHPDQVPTDDSLIVPVAEQNTNVSDETGAFGAGEQATQEEAGAIPTQLPFAGMYDSLIVGKKVYEPVTDAPSLMESTVSENKYFSSSQNDKAIDQPVTEPLPSQEADILEDKSPSKEVGEGTEGFKPFGIFEKILNFSSESISVFKDVSILGFLSRKTEEDSQPGWQDSKPDSVSPFDDTCKIEDLNCPSLKQVEKLESPTMDAVSSEILFSSLLEPLLGSTCLKAQGLLIFLTTAVVLVSTTFGYFYFEKRYKDASLYRKIDSLEKRLFISEKEALELKNRSASVTSPLINAESESTLLLKTTQIIELEAQRDELCEKVELLANELTLTRGMNQELEKRLQEVLPQTQNMEMIFKTVDQLQQRIEMQQKASSELLAQLKNKDKTIEGLEEAMQKSSTYVSKLEEIITSLKKENEVLSIESSEKIINLNSELDQIKSEKTLEATKLKAEIDSLKLSLEQARSSLDVAEANIVELKAIISDDAKSSDSLGDVFNGSELKAKLAVAELNIEKLKDRLQEETGARQFLEEHVLSNTEALNKLKADYHELEKQKQEAENAVKVLKDYFKKQEEELKKEIEEKSAFQLQKDEETLFMKLKTLEEEKGSLKVQIEEMKKEIVEQETIFKRERVQLEKKADDNWLLSRQINRKLQDAKQEAAVLRSRLTTVEKVLSERNEHDPNDNEQSVTNGEGMPQPNVSSPSMLLNFPNTSNSSFANYNSADLVLPPPLGLPGNEFIPPPPINYPDLRLPPLGSVGRMSSPPRGMSPPLSLETNFGINFSPPPPMPPQYYYYHRSDSPSDYDSSYSKGDRYRDSPSNLEGGGSSKIKPDPLRKVPADQADSYPASNPSHPSPLKPVARNPTSSGQKGWPSSGSNKSVEKNSRKSGR